MMPHQLDREEMMTREQVRVTGSTDGVVYTIDMADFYVVPEPYAAPDNIISVVDKGADPTGQQDSTKALQDTIDAASASGKGERSSHQTSSMGITSCPRDRTTIID